MLITMVQREVALKFASSSGSKEFCSLSVITSSCGEARVLFDVPPKAFNPPPKVISSVLEIKKYKDFRRDGFEKFLRVAFSQPRKTLLKNLSSKYNKASLIRIFKAFLYLIALIFRTLQFPSWRDFPANSLIQFPLNN